MSVTGPDENELRDGLSELKRRRHSAGVQRGLRDAGERGFYIFPRAPYGYRKIVVSDLEVWPESHRPGFALRQADVLQSYTA